MSNSAVLPSVKSAIRRSFFRHLIFDDKKKFIFCFLPKVRYIELHRTFEWFKLIYMECYVSNLSLAHLFVHFSPLQELLHSWNVGKGW